MQALISTVLKRKKIVILTLRQTNNNLFGAGSTATFEENVINNYIQKSHIKFIKKNRKRGLTLQEYLKQNVEKNLNKKFLPVIKGRFIRKKFNKNITLTVKKRYIIKFKKITPFLGNLKQLNKLNNLLLIQRTNKKLRKRIKKIKYLKKKSKLNFKYNFLDFTSKPKRRTFAYKRNPEFIGKNKFKFAQLLQKHKRFAFKLFNYKFKLKKMIKCYNSARFKRHNIILNKYKNLRLSLGKYLNLVNNNPLNLHLLLKTQRLRCMKSNGSIGFKGPKRQTPFASEKLGVKLGRYIKKNKFLNYSLLIILRTPFSPNLRAFFRGFFLVRPKISYIIPIFKVPHNRMRNRKPRRV